MSAIAINRKPLTESKSLGAHALGHLLSDRVAILAIMIVLAYTIIALLVKFDIVAADWAMEVGGSHEAPSMEHWFGTDIFGRSVFLKTIRGAGVAMKVGFLTAALSMSIGVVLGAVAGYFGGFVDEIIVWFYTTVSSVPQIMLLIAIALIMGKGENTVCVALGVTGWVSLCRLIRGEVMRHKEREYVHAASAIGSGHGRKLFLHILPNVFHIVIIKFSLQFQTAIKSEVILSYLGLGVQGQPSWGTMINDAKDELSRNVWWGLAAATVAMFIIVLALNILGDVLRDALDPKLKGK